MLTNASTKVTRASAIAGLIVAATYGLQEVQGIENLHPLVKLAAAGVITILGTFGAGYRTIEKNAVYFKES